MLESKANANKLSLLAFIGFIILSSTLQYIVS